MRKSFKKFTVKNAEAFLGIDAGSLSHIPSYCRDSAIIAIAQVRQREMKKLFRPGVYYIVLADLCSSTKSSAKLGMELNKKRIQTFITAAVEALGNSEPESYSHYLRDVGDAALFLFSSMEDVFNWWLELNYCMSTYNSQWQKELTSSDFRAFRLKAKTVVHLGEVDFTSGSNPVSLAVNQVFKIEKLFSENQLGATDAVKRIAAPRLRSLGIKPRRHEMVVLPEDRIETQTWILKTIK